MEEVTELLIQPSSRYFKGNQSVWMLIQLWMLAPDELVRAISRGLYMTISAVNKRTH